MTQDESSEQFDVYAELAVDMACKDIDKLSDKEFIDQLGELPQKARDRVLEHISSEAFSNEPEDKRLGLWIELSRFIRNHRDFASRSWALREDEVAKIEKVADRLSPDNPLAAHRLLFSSYDLPLYSDWKDWDDLGEKRKRRREHALKDILAYGGVDAVTRFAQEVEKPKFVGNALAELADAEIDGRILPEMLDVDDEKLTLFSQGYVWVRRCKSDWEWADGLDKSDWTDTQIGRFLSWLPFTEEAWKRAEAWLGEKEGEYWHRTGAGLRYGTEGDIGLAINKLIEHQRAQAALQYLALARRARESFDRSLALRALLAPWEAGEPVDQDLRYSIIEIIKDLQRDPKVNQEELMRVEWRYLPLLERHLGVSPKTLEFKLASDPNFYCQIIQLIFLPEGQTTRSGQLSEHQKTLAQSAYSLLFEWNTPPGTQSDGTFSPAAFTEWLDSVKIVCGESGHLGIALEQVGEVLVHCPPDPDGLWVHRTVAEALNDRNVAAMREGFSIGISNSRGIYTVDITGEQERKLARKYRRKANEIENEGFRRLAITIREIAKHYDREAERNIGRGNQLD